MKKLLSLALGLAVVGCSGSGDSGEEVAQGNPPAVEIETDDSGKPNQDQARAQANRQSQRPPQGTQASLSKAPAWTLPGLEGQRINSSDFDGKIVILDFWATWCGPCKMEIPHFKELYAEYSNQGVEIVGVALDQQGLQKVAPFVKQWDINYHTVIGNQRIAMEYGVTQGIPTTYVLNRDGEIFRRYVGYRPKEVFKKDIETLLGTES